MASKDFALNFICNKLAEGVSDVELIEYLELNEKSMWAIKKVIDSDEKWGQKLNFLDVIDIYKDGFTLAEIGWLRGVSEEAIRLIVKNSTHKDFETLKSISKHNRKVMADIVNYDISVICTELYGKKVAWKNSGYVRQVFDKIYRKSVKWKMAVDENNLLGNLKINSIEDSDFEIF